jgi:hypothetical protein
MRALMPARRWRVAEVLVVLVLISGFAVAAPRSYPLFKQCDPRWHVLFGVVLHLTQPKGIQ